VVNNNLEDKSISNLHEKNSSNAKKTQAKIQSQEVALKKQKWIQSSLPQMMIQ
jgi:hypothetical protein